MVRKLKLFKVNTEVGYSGCNEEYFVAGEEFADVESQMPDIVRAKYVWTNVRIHIVSITCLGDIYMREEK